MRDIKIQRASNFRRTGNKHLLFSASLIICGILISMAFWSLIPLYLSFGIAITIFFLDTLVSSGTDQIHFKDHTIIITKKQSQTIFTSNTTYQTVVDRHIWSGVKLISDNNEVFIWKHEFDSSSWQRIKLNMKNFTFIPQGLYFNKFNRPYDKLDNSRP